MFKKNNIRNMLLLLKIKPIFSVAFDKYGYLVVKWNPYLFSIKAGFYFSYNIPINIRAIIRDCPLTNNKIKGRIIKRINLNSCCMC